MDGSDAIIRSREWVLYIIFIIYVFFFFLSFSFLPFFIILYIFYFILFFFGIPHDPVPFSYENTISPRDRLDVSLDIPGRLFNTAWFACARDRLPSDVE